MAPEFLGILLMLLLAAGVAGLLIVLTSVLGPKRPSAAKAEPFECGVSPMMLPQGRFPVKFYVLGMLFIVFDVELVFMFPWAVNVRGLGWLGLAEMGVFVLIVLAGFAYAWKKRALEFD